MVLSCPVTWQERGAAVGMVGWGRVWKVASCKSMRKSGEGAAQRAFSGVRPKKGDAFLNSPFAMQPVIAALESFAPAPEEQLASAAFSRAATERCAWNDLNGCGLYFGRLRTKFRRWRRFLLQCVGSCLVHAPHCLLRLAVARGGGRGGSPPPSPAPQAGESKDGTEGLANHSRKRARSS